MLDQNIVTLLSTLLGAALAMASSYVASKHANKLNREQIRYERTKEALEKIYTLVEDNGEQFFTTIIKALVESQQNNKMSLSISLKLGRNLRQISMLVNLYVPSLREYEKKYQKEINLKSQELHMAILNGEDDEKIDSIHKDIIRARDSFIAAISVIAQMKGYGDI